jgi:hypothetical protein
VKLDEFPTHVATVLVALGLIIPTGALVLIRMARGLPALEGYGDWYIFLGSLAGVTTLGMIGKRLTTKIVAGELPTKEELP